MAEPRPVWAVAAIVTLVSAALALTVTVPLRGQAPPSAGDVTFARDIAPILQRSCQECHHADGVAPMSLVTYDEVRPWARAMKMRTALRSQRGAMPPFFVEKNIGIQKFKHDPSLTDEEIARVAKWADSGAPRGDRARHAAAAQVRRHRQVDDRRTGSGPEIQGSARPGVRAPTGGATSVRCRPA